MDWQKVVIQHKEGDWQREASEEESRNAQENNLESRQQEMPTTRGVSDFGSLEEATTYNLELRELLSRRSVSTILVSEFRERMDQLILSYLQNQGRPPIAWDLQEEEQEAEEQDDIGQNEGPFNIRNGQAFITPLPRPPPPPPPHQFWRHEIRRQSRSRSIL